MSKVRILKALSDPTRIKILESLKDGKELCGCEFDEMFDQTQSTISRHLKSLEDADLIISNKVGQKKLYRIKDPHLFEIFATLDQMIKRNKKYKQIVKLQEQITL
ncbi:MAG: ArsR/SmtB family transcription factor [Promethearchaeota archaeon]